MDASWIQTISIMATVIGSAYYIHRESQQDIKKQGDRIDKLYEIWVETQKEIKQIYIDRYKPDL